MNGDVRPNAYGLNVFAQKPHSNYDAKQLPVDTGAFASIGLPHKHKLLDVHLDVEKTQRKHTKSTLLARLPSWISLSRTLTPPWYSL